MICKEFGIGGLSVLVCLFVTGCGGQSASDSTASAGAGGLGTAAVATGPLVIDASGGPAGKVATAVELLEPGVGPEMTCDTPQSSGACQLTSCKFGGIGSPGPGYGNFGPIAVSAGNASVQLTYDGVGYGTVYFPSSVTLGAGDTMTFRGGNGSSVPKFDVVATIPGLAVITAPVPATAGGSTMLDSSLDLSVTWLPISLGQILFRLDGGASSSSGTALALTCAFDGDAGTGVVPSALLSAMKELSTTTTAYGTLSSELDAMTVVDGLSITTRSRQGSDSTNDSFTATLQ